MATATISAPGTERPSVPASRGHRVRRPSRVAVLGSALLAACLVMTFVSLMIGAQVYSAGEVWSALTGGAGEHANVITGFQLPRVLLCWVVGGGLAVAGGVMQGVIRNPLAAPNILGVTHGAGFAAVFVVLAVPAAPTALLPLIAFAGGLLAFVIVYAGAFRHGTTPARLALVGIAVSALFEAGILFCLVRYPNNTTSALTWLAGSLYGRTMTSFWEILPWFAVLVPVLLLYSHRLDTLGLGDDLAAGLGEPVERTRLTTLFLAVALSAAVVASAGTVGFVGLVAPHIARRLVGGRHRTFLPVAALIGTLLMLVADTIARGVIPPLEIPSGLVTSAIGAPYFLYLLTKTGTARPR